MFDVMPTILIAAAGGGHSDGDPAQQVQSLMYAPLMWLAWMGIGVLVLGILLSLWRMVRGPHLADRVLAGDTMAMLVAGLVVVLSIKYRSGMFFDAALVVAILGFASTLAFSQYIGAKHKHAPDNEKDNETDSSSEPKTNGEGGAA